MTIKEALERLEELGISKDSKEANYDFVIYDGGDLYYIDHISLDGEGGFVKIYYQDKRERD